MFRDISLGGPGSLDNLTDRPGLVADSLQDPQSHLFAEHSEKGSEASELRIGKGLVSFGV